MSLESYIDEEEKLSKEVLKYIVRLIGINNEIYRACRYDTDLRAIATSSHGKIRALQDLQYVLGKNKYRDLLITIDNRRKEEDIRKERKEAKRKNRDKKAR